MLSSLPGNQVWQDEAQDGGDDLHSHSFSSISCQESRHARVTPELHRRSSIQTSMAPSSHRFGWVCSAQHKRDLKASLLDASAIQARQVLPA